MEMGKFALEAWSVRDRWLNRRTVGVVNFKDQQRSLDLKVK